MAFCRMPFRRLPPLINHDDVGVILPTRMHPMRS